MIDVLISMTRSIMKNEQFKELKEKLAQMWKVKVKVFSVVEAFGL